MRCLLLYLGAVFLGAALLAPWLYWTAQWAGERSPSMARLSSQPFHRYVNRSLLGLALAGLWPLLRGIGAASWQAVGLARPAGNWHRLGFGFALGFASLACVALLAVVAGARVVNSEFSGLALLNKVGSAGLTAVTVGFLEELLFRGALFGALRKVHRWPIALVVSSALYAIVHFFQKPSPPDQITWTSGLELLPRMCRGFADFQMLVPGFFALLLAGIILGLAFQRTGNLYFSIGLHAGWIFWLKFYGSVTLPAAAASAWFWGSSKLIDGWLALAVLLPVLGTVWLLPRKTAPSPHAA